MLPFLTSRRVAPRALLATIALLPALAAQECRITDLPYPRAATFDYVGGAVALTDEWAFVGAQGDDPRLPPNLGGVAVWRRVGGNWFFVERLLPAEDTTGWVEFGAVLFATDDELFVGAPLEDAPGGIPTNRGAVFVFERDGGGWTQAQKLVSIDGQSFDAFGQSVVSDGERLFIGAPGDDDAGTGAGVLHVFERDDSGWVFREKVVPTFTQINEMFGASLALAGEDVIVGAPIAQDPSLNFPGAVYVLREVDGAMTIQSKLFAADAANGDCFGAAVAAEGDIFVSGAREDTIPIGMFEGSATVFRRGATGVWSEEQKLLAIKPVSYAYFGTSVALYDGRILVGAPGGITAGSGAAYLFELQGAAWVGTLEFGEDELHDRAAFGEALALYETTALVGAFFAHTPGGPDLTGRAFLWSLFGEDCPTLTAAVESLSLSSGGTQALTLDAPAALAGERYLTLGTASGSYRGFAVLDGRLPLALDAYFLETLRDGPSSFLVGGAGTLDANGDATTNVVVPPGTDPSLIGLTLQHATVVHGLGPPALLHVSNPVAVTLQA